MRSSCYLPDDTELIADGADSTRLVLRVTDEFGAVQPFANDAIKFELEGPASIVGDNPFALIGGTVAVWIRAQEKPGKVRIPTYLRLGNSRRKLRLSPALGRLSSYTRINKCHWEQVLLPPYFFVGRQSLQKAPCSHSLRAITVIL